MAYGEGCTGACPSPPQLQLYQTIIFATPVLFAFMLMLMFCLLYFRRRSRAATIHAHIRAQLFAESLFATPPLEQGLSTSFRQKLPIILFNNEFKSTSQDTRCTVCLNDYQLNEKLRQLPLCNHLFHVPCIDEWLAKNTTCPICRLSLSEVDIGGFTDPCQSGEGYSMQRGADATRVWEERVVSGAQDHTLQVRVTTSDEESICDATSSEHDPRRVGSHTINIERI
eukprot:c21188_g1_i2 orf=258-935(+)